MTSINGAVLRRSREPQVQAALALLERAVSDGGHITASAETQVQNALHGLRAASPYCEAMASLEAAAAKLRQVAEARRAGRCNLYASQLIRLRKELMA